jgi:uncharacterized Zn finger protein
MGWGFYSPYVPVAQRRANALREVQRLARKGQQVSPVQIAGPTIASTFWGKAWCDNLESYSDFRNRLPRGRTYVRNGSVVDLKIEPGRITSLVSGSSLYRIAICIKPLDAQRWKRLKQQCGAGIGSVVELLQGRLSTNVMAIVTSRGNGLFPAPAEIEMSCSCPDWADMCKHVAATLYGVGSRLDRNPELFFKLRQVDHLELITQAGHLDASYRKTSKKTIGKDQLADVFGIELESDGGTTRSASAQQAQSKRGGKAVVAGETSDRAATRRARDEASPVTGRSASPKRKMLSAKERKRIAEAQKKRWEALRRKWLSNDSNETALSPTRTAKTTKAQPAKPAGTKSTRRSRAV